MIFFTSSGNITSQKATSNHTLATLKDLATLTGGQVVGNPELEISGVSEIQNGSPSTITFLSNPKYLKYASDTEASAILVSEQDQLSGKDGIIVPNPQFAFAKVLSHFYTKPKVEEGTHPTSIISDGATIGKNVCVGPYSIIEEDATIGDDTVIGSNVNIGTGSSIGSSCAIHNNVQIYHECFVGNECTIFSGTVIGSDGFGYVENEGVHHKIPQTGGVSIGNNVDIGASCTIDRGTISDTMIGDGCKLDNLVHIAHNVRIGRGCLLAAQVGIAGSVEIEDFCIFAGHSGVVPHVKIGSKAIFAVKSGVTKSLPGGTIYAGMPAREIKEQNKKDAILLEVDSIKKRLQKLEL